jgi:NosR/NirI family nitrous oxide reductase transcriptional regulator
VQAIHPTGEINPNEYVNCLHCQVLYQSATTCPVVIKKLKRREAVGHAPRAGLADALSTAACLMPGGGWGHHTGRGL